MKSQSNKDVETVVKEAEAPPPKTLTKADVSAYVESFIDPEMLARIKTMKSTRTDKNEKIQSTSRGNQDVKKSASVEKYKVNESHRIISRHSSYNDHRRSTSPSYDSYEYRPSIKKSSPSYESYESHRTYKKPPPREDHRHSYDNSSYDSRNQRSRRLYDNSYEDSSYDSRRTYDNQPKHRSRDKYSSSSAYDNSKAYANPTHQRCKPFSFWSKMSFSHYSRYRQKNRTWLKNRLREILGSRYVKQ